MPRYVVFDNNKNVMHVIIAPDYETANAKDVSGVHNVMLESDFIVKYGEPGVEKNES